MIQIRGRGAKRKIVWKSFAAARPAEEREEKQPGLFLIPDCYFVLSRQMATQNITKHREVKWLIKNLRGPCNKRTVCTLFNVAGGSPAGIYHHWYVSGGHIRFQACRCFISIHSR